MALSRRFEDALIYAAQVHAEQVRKASSVPYVAHLISAAGIVLEYGGTEDEVIAALLHDAVEDQGGRARLEEIRHRFGSTIADLVEGCSEPFEGPELSWRDKKDAYLAKLRDASPSVVLVATADKVHNAASLLRDHRRIGDRIWKTFSKQGTLWFYREFLRTVAATGHHPELVDELRDAIRLLGRL